MGSRAVAVVFVVTVWWLSTGIVLRTVWLDRKATKASVAAASVLAALGLASVAWSARETSVLAAYVGFAGAIAIWAFHEVVFLLGLVTGPRKIACPDDARGMRRFRYATEAVLHHELALAATLVVVSAVAWGAPNQVGPATFLVLWAMRLSAKLNVFLGVRSLTEEFVPTHLRYLISYFRRARWNPLMPLSVVSAGLVTFWLGQDALLSASDHVRVARTLVASLLALAVMEHLFLAIPFREALLWRWALRETPGTR